MNRQSNINKLYPVINDNEVIQLVKYGHIQRGDNHYQFYFDFERLTEYRRDSIEEWAKECGKGIDSGAYNIVISPLQKTNSEFLKIIIERTFGSNLHLLHINITDTGKENIRTKYSYIAEDIKKIITAGQQIKFYYVDDSICTGNAVARAYKFLQMLYSQAGIGISDFKFEKVFLLVNRSSYETALTWVKDPNEDWYGFINLRVPSYNTHSDTCPGCRVMDRYELLRKRSATSELIDYFGDRAEKQAPRSPQEYDIWKSNEISKNPTYKKLLNLRRLANNIKEIANKVGEKEEKEIREMIAEEDFRRLQTMDNAYSKLIFGELSEDKSEEEIWKLLSGSFKSTYKKFNKDLYKAVQEFYSYIKVISRDYLAKNYIVKKAVLNVLINLFDDLVISEGEWEEKSKVCPENEIKIISNIRFGELPASMQYNALKLIIRRLAIMRSDYIIYPKNIIKIVRAYGLLKNKHEQEKFKNLAPLPDDDTVIVDYVASIKTATMEENDDGMCCKLLDTVRALRFLLIYRKDELSDIKDILLKFIHNLTVENNRIFYDLMEELSNRITNFDDDITSDWKYEGYVGEGGFENRKIVIRELCSNACTLLEECKEGDLYQNPLSSFVRFYKKALFSGGNHIPYAERKKIAEMINGFNILRFLTEPEYKKERHAKFDSLPYIYEDLCLSLKNMTGAMSSYIVYIKDGEASQLVSRSGYVIDKEADEKDAYPLDENPDEFSALNIGSSEFGLLIKEFDGGDVKLEKRKNSEIILKTVNEQIISGVGIVDTNQVGVKDHRFMLFKIPVKQGSGNAEDKRKFFIILELPFKSADYLKIAVRVLFLRNRIWEALSKHYSALLNFRFYVNYMRSVDATDDKNLKIMHISDMHLNDDETWSIGSKKLKALFEGLNNENNIDLLAVTGDIVEASSDSLTAQRKYKRAANLLFEIAKKLWGVEDENGVLLPHDWKRRIIITTGNHDYAAMNDVRVQTKSRKIETGLPASSTGGTMSKYTYYLEFLSYFLDAPTQRLLKNDLNEVRYYSNIKPNLKLAVGVFNTSSKANALQNNKVSIDNEKLEIVLKDGGWYDGEEHKTYLALMHHSPHYAAKYFDDKYGYWKFSEDLKKVFGSLDFDSLYKEKYMEALTYMYGFEKRARKTVDDFLNEFNELKKACECTENKDLDEFKESVLFAEMKLFKKILDGEMEDSDEFVQQFISNTKNLFLSELLDNDNMKSSKALIFKEIKSNIAVLAGHIHDNEYIKKFPTTFVVDKLFKRGNKEKNINDKMSIGIVTVSEDNVRGIVWQGKL